MKISNLEFDHGGTARLYIGETGWTVVVSNRTLPDNLMFFGHRCGSWCPPVGPMICRSCGEEVPKQAKLIYSLLKLED